MKHLYRNCLLIFAFSSTLVYSQFLQADTSDIQSEKKIKKMNVYARYHRESNHTYENLRDGNPFRRGTPPGTQKLYAGEKHIPLNIDSDLGNVRFEDTVKKRQPVSEFSTSGISFNDLSALLFYSDGPTKVFQYQRGTFVLRAAPSAGALYPLELYVIVNNVAGLTGGLYHYNVKDNSVALIKEADMRKVCAEICNDPTLENADIVCVVTNVFSRATYKYGLRGYRYSYLDAGHVEANMCLTAESLGLGSKGIGVFDDNKLIELLEIDGDIESPAFACSIGNVQKWGKAPTKLTKSIKRAKSEEVDSEYNEGTKEQLGCALDESIRDSAPAFVLNLSQDSVLEKARQKGFEVVKIDSPQSMKGTRLDEIIYYRRSNRDYWDQAIPADLLSYILTYSAGFLKRTGYVYPSLSNNYPIDIYVGIHNVKGIKPGIYYYSPQYSRLEVIRQGDYRKQCADASLGQRFVGDANFIVMMAIHFDRAVSFYGDRGYRNALIDAGCIGEHVYLSAESMGLGACGVGAYLDKPINDIVKIDGVHESVVYFVTVGRLQR